MFFHRSQWYFCADNRDRSYFQHELWTQSAMLQWFCPLSLSFCFALFLCLALALNKTHTHFYEFELKLIVIHALGTVWNLNVPKCTSFHFNNIIVSSWIFSLIEHRFMYSEVIFFAFYFFISFVYVSISEFARLKV